MHADDNDAVAVPVAEPLASVVVTEIVVRFGKEMHKPGTLVSSFEQRIFEKIASLSFPGSKEVGSQ